MPVCAVLSSTSRNFPTFTNTRRGDPETNVVPLRSYASDDRFKSIHFVSLHCRLPDLQDTMDDLQIDTTPTFLLFKHGKVVDKVVGACKGELVQMIDKWAVDENEQTA